MRGPRAVGGRAPAEARELLRTGSPLNLQPLVGGLPPDVASPYLEAAAAISAGGD